ncbi:uncharacterized protein MAM_02544 [Metarhizium album ARSEF 1941]|uniref:Uncharacterized protein n=1 Tax=Metarhizium album (strain ARSEF 1941) TaxID=1081103 RepID=A0A0B2WUE0_METAS|nr:uncharacterized protein MAM_02544 [Metarhizium album ARSEF 1941]KHN99691.1 hypothetical protein MAM_02544 [Metarhizium album ARSEF 1941]
MKRPFSSPEPGSIPSWPYRSELPQSTSNMIQTHDMGPYNANALGQQQHHQQQQHQAVGEDAFLLYHNDNSGMHQIVQPQSLDMANAQANTWSPELNRGRTDEYQYESDAHPAKRLRGRTYGQPSGRQPQMPAHSAQVQTFGQGLRPPGAYGGGNNFAGDYFPSGEVDAASSLAFPNPRAVADASPPQPRLHQTFEGYSQPRGPGYYAVDSPGTGHAEYSGSAANPGSKPTSTPPGVRAQQISAPAQDYDVTESDKKRLRAKAKALEGKQCAIRRKYKRTREPNYESDPEKVYLAFEDFKRLFEVDLKDFGRSNARNVFQFQYDRHGQLLGQDFESNQIREFVHRKIEEAEASKKASGGDGIKDFKMWIQSSPCQVKDRLKAHDNTCRWSQCKAERRTVASGWFRVAFDEFPYYTSHGDKFHLDPLKPCLVLHLCCFEQVFQRPEMRKFHEQEYLVGETRKAFGKEVTNIVSLVKEKKGAMNVIKEWADASDDDDRVDKIIDMIRQFRKSFYDTAVSYDEIEREYGRSHLLSLSCLLNLWHADMHPAYVNGSAKGTRSKARRLRNKGVQPGAETTFDFCLGSLNVFARRLDARTRWKSTAEGRLTQARKREEAKTRVLDKVSKELEAKEKRKETAVVEVEDAKEAVQRAIADYREAKKKHPRLAEELEKAESSAGSDDAAPETTTSADVGGRRGRRRKNPVQKAESALEDARNRLESAQEGLKKLDREISSLQTRREGDEEPPPDAADPSTSYKAKKRRLHDPSDDEKQPAKRVRVGRHPSTSTASSDRNRERTTRRRSSGGSSVFVTKVCSAVATKAGGDSAAVKAEEPEKSIQDVAPFLGAHANQHPGVTGQHDVFFDNFDLQAYGTATSYTWDALCGPGDPNASTPSNFLEDQVDASGQMLPPAAPATPQQQRPQQETSEHNDDGNTCRAEQALPEASRKRGRQEGSDDRPEASRKRRRQESQGCDEDDGRREGLDDSPEASRKRRRQESQGCDEDDGRRAGSDDRPEASRKRRRQESHGCDEGDGSSSTAKRARVADAQQTPDAASAPPDAGESRRTKRRADDDVSGEPSVKRMRQ